jgi:hypothetical protein
MTEQPPSLSDRQLKTAEVLERINAARSKRRMAAVFCWVLLVLFVADSAFLLYASFSSYGDKIAKYVTLGLDGLLGTLLVIVARHLFPPTCKDRDGVVREIEQ